LIASLSPRPTVTVSKVPISHHDIPPEIVIDVGSFSIETDKSITADVMPTKRGTYKIPNKDVLMMLIKVIRTDDGAILYQNFDAHDTEVVFTTAGAKTITIKPGETSDRKKTLEFESSETENLAAKSIPPINRRIYRLYNDNYTIKNITVKKGTATLFSHDTPDILLTDKEYSDKRYRVFIRVELAD